MTSKTLKIALNHKWVTNTRRENSIQTSTSNKWSHFVIKNSFTPYAYSAWYFVARSQALNLKSFCSCHLITVKTNLLVIIFKRSAFDSYKKFQINIFNLPYIHDPVWWRVFKSPWDCYCDDDDLGKYNHDWCSKKNCQNWKTDV